MAVYLSKMAATTVGPRPCSTCLGGTCIVLGENEVSHLENETK